MSAARAARTTTAIRFGVDLHDRLAAAAAARHISINELVAACCEYALLRLRAPAPRNLFVDDDTEDTDEADGT